MLIRKMNEYNDELELAINAAKVAGNEILKIYETDFDINYKDDESPVTSADLASEKAILEVLKNTNYGIISEESDMIENSEGVYWVIDPMDGTKDFIHKTGEFSVMIALMKDSQPVLGVVFAPAMNKLWFAVKGQGSFLIEDNKEAKKLSVSDVSDPEKAVMVISRNHFSDKDKEYPDRLGIVNFKEMGSVGPKFGEIAEGKAELCAYTTYNLWFWDVAAPQIILTEANGKVFDNEGKDVEYDFSTMRVKNGFIGSNGHISS